MSLKKGLMIIIIISILMAKFRTTRGRIYEEKYKNHRELNKLNYHGFQTRHHNHYFHKKHHKCHFDRPYGRQSNAKRLSRYPTLDKIVHRLDNGIDYVDKSKMTTVNPFDEWNLTTPVTTTLSDRSHLYTYYTVGMKTGSDSKGSSKDLRKSHYNTEAWTEDDLNIKLSSYSNDSVHSVRVSVGSGGGVGGDDDDNTNINDFESEIYKDKLLQRGNDRSYKSSEFHYNDNNNNIVLDGGKSSFSKDFMQDHSTSSPLENEQHDISSRVGESAKDNSSTTSTPLAQPSTTEESVKKDLNISKLPFWSLSRLVPRVTPGENRKKPSTPMPYVAAHEHYEQVLRMGDCHIPKQKVIRVHEVHPDPSKSYSPSCTILHQCGDDTGCCRDLKQVCKPKNTTKVELYFFTTTVGKPQTVEKLHFVNHTECECQKRTDEPMSRDSEFRWHYPKKVASVRGSDEKRKNNCTCPSRYTARFIRNGSCMCDCFDKQDDCLILKKGKAHFSYHDKLCIHQGHCLQPSCEFGSYIRQFGRCPNRSEKYHFIRSRVLSYRDLIT